MTKLQLKPVKMFNYPLTEEQEFKRSNIFNARPKGFIIFDSYNNPFYQLIQVDLDDAKLSYTNIKQELKRKNWRGYFMPWHYWVEMVGIDYITIQSRPLDYRSALPGFEEYICICIAGNSHNDIYMKTLYKNIADIIMSSLHYMPGWKLNGHDETQLINLGRAFDHHQLEKMLR